MDELPETATRSASVGSRFRNVFITLNNPEPEELEKIQALIESDLVTHAVGSKEHWTGGGTPHIHVGIRFRGQVTLNPAFRLQHGLNRADQRAIRQVGAVWRYIRKEGDNTPHNPMWEEGVCGEFCKGESPETQGKRGDLDDVVQAIEDGATFSDIAVSHPVQSIKFHSGILRNIQARQAPRSLEALPRVLSLYGTTGSGKSRTAHSILPEVSRYVKCPSTANWWDGYQGEELLVLEEFRGQITKAQFFRLVDRYSARVQLKGSCCQIQATSVVICSPKPPRLWWTWEEDGDADLESQLERRLTENPESRIFNTTLGSFVSYSGDAVTQSVPSWLSQMSQIFGDIGQ